MSRSHQSGKFPLYRKLRVGYSKCHAINYRDKEKVKNVWYDFFLIKSPYFDLQNSNPMFIFVGRDRKTSIIREKYTFFSGLSKLSDTVAGFPCDKAAIGLAQRLQRFTSSHAAYNMRFRTSQIFGLIRKN